MRTIAGRCAVAGTNAGVMRVAFVGHSIVLTITAQEVLTTNGQIENAGKTVKLVIPFTDLLSGSPELPDRFVAELRY